MYDFWNNITLLQNNVAYLKAGMVIFGLLAALAGVGQFVIGRRVDNLQSSVNTRNNAEREQVIRNLSKTVEGRHIPSSLKKEIITNLSKYKQQQAHVTTMMVNTESIHFGREVLDVLRDAGWNVARDVAQAVPHNPRAGVILMVRDDPPPERVHALTSVMELLEIKNTVEYWRDWDQFKAGEIDIYIGMME